MSEQPKIVFRTLERKSNPRNRELAIIGVIYAVAWGLMLLNGGRYWDDWCMFQLSKSNVLELGSMIGQLWQPYYWYALSWWPGVNYMAHAAVFVSYLVAALALYGIVSRIPSTDSWTRVIVPVLFAVFPVNAARFALVDLQYAVSFAVFFLAWYMVAVDLDNPSLIRRVLTALLLIAAMITTNSLMVFVVLIPLYVCWVWWSERGVGSDALRLVRRYGYLVLLPVITWSIRGAYLKPWGLYAKYNEVKWAEAYWNLGAWPDAFMASVVTPVMHVSWLVIPCALLAYLLIRGVCSDLNHRPMYYAALVAIGFATFFVGVAPYLAVGKLPSSANLDGWDSRHQLLVPLGAALMVYGLVMLVLTLVRARPWVLTAVFSVIIGVFIASAVRTCVMYQVDWYKQLALISHMRTTPEFRKGNTFLFVDKATKYNADHRLVLSYEFNGMMQEVFGDATRFGSERDIFIGWARQFNAYLPYHQYHYWQYKLPPRAYTVTIAPGPVDGTRPGTLIGMMFDEHFAPKRFQRRIDNLIELTAVPTK